MSEHNSTISAKPHSLLYGSTGRPLSMTGSLSSIIHSEEELAGSYNWDYLLDWCPQYQNLAHVFKEISKLKDDDSGGVAAVRNSFAIKNPSIGMFNQSYLILKNGCYLIHLYTNKLKKSLFIISLVPILIHIKNFILIELFWTKAGLSRIVDNCNFYGEFLKIRTRLWMD